MRLSEYLQYAGCECTLVSDGEFQALEQCTRIRGEQALTFLENPKYIAALDNKQISCVVCSPLLRDMIPSHIQGVLVTDAPKSVFFRIHNVLAAQQELYPTQIDPSAKISAQAYIAPHNVVIGKNVEIGPFVAVHENTTIQNNVRICSGTVIGGQSFSVAKSPESCFVVRDAGSTVIEEDVEICSNCHIASGLLQKDVTRLGASVKLDAQIHLAHGVVVGPRTLMAAGVVVGGNTTIGENVWLGLNATVSNGITIGDNARVSLGSVVTKDVPAGETVTGNFAIPHQRFMKNLKNSIREDD